MKNMLLIFFLPLLLAGADVNFYIWQRRHTPAVEYAAKEFLQMHPSGKLFYLAGELEDIHKTVSIPPSGFVDFSRSVPVIRIHIKLLSLPPAQLAKRILPIYENWKHCQALQIDLDAPERSLDYYRQLMAELRKHLPGTELSATVLPCHLRRKASFLKLADECDFFVLQVHGLTRKGESWSIMDNRTAFQAVADAINCRRPFKIALPLYSHIIAGETVKPDLPFVCKLARFAREQNIGVIGFRLGVANDPDALDLPTALQLLYGNKYLPETVLSWQKTSGGAWHLHIKNLGRFTERVTFKMVWKKDFTVRDTDTFNGAFLNAGELTLTMPPAGSSKPFLWLRCDTEDDLNKLKPLTIIPKE